MDILSTDANVREELARSLKQLVDDADDLLAKAERTGSEQFNAARERFKAQARVAKEELRQLEGSAADRARRAAHATDHAVREHPYSVIGIAAGVGLLLGMLVTRR